MNTTPALKLINYIKESIIRNRKLLFNILKLLIAFGLIFFIVSYINPSEIVNAFVNSNPILILLTVLFLPLNILFQFKRWEIVCRELLDEKDKQKIILSLFYGFSAGAFTPMRVGEYFGRAIPFRDKNLIDVTLATVVDKLFPLLIVLYTGALAVLLFMHFHYKMMLLVTLPMFAVVVLLFYFSFLLFTDPGFWNNIIFKKIKSSQRLYKLLSHLRVLKKLKKEIAAKMTLITLAQYITFILQFALLAAAFSAEYNVFTFLWAGCLLMFTKTVIPPITIGEFGVREAASVYFITQLGGTAAAAFNASIFLFIINILMPSFVGLVLLLKKNDN